LAAELAEIAEALGKDNDAAGITDKGWLAVALRG